MKKSVFYLLLSLIVYKANSQTQKTSFICSYYGNPKYTKSEICGALSFTSNAEAEQVVDNILSEVGLKRNFIVMEYPKEGLKNKVSFLKL